MGLKPPFSLSSIAAALLVACAGAGTGPTPPPAPPPPPPPPPSPVVASVAIAPRGLTLPVGGQGQLTAVTQDASGAPVTGATITWASRNAVVATVGANGTVSGNAAGLTGAVATSGGKTDSVDVLVISGLTLAVSPATASVAVGGTVPFTVVARDGAGNVVAAPSVVWTSSNPTAATVANTGIATGVSPGTTDIVAAAGGVRSPPAVLIVTPPPAAACDGITGVATFNGDIDYGYKVSATSDGGFDITADDLGHLTASMIQLSAGPFAALWSGNVAGNASITQQKSSGPDVSTLSGGGAIVGLPGGLGRIQMSLIVNLQACTFLLKAGAVISTVLTEANGTKRNDDQIVATIQFSGPLGAWRQLGLSGPNGSIAAQSTGWGALHPDVNTLMPLGFATSLFTSTDASVGEASGGYLVVKAP